MDNIRANIKQRDLTMLMIKQSTSRVISQTTRNKGSSETPKGWSTFALVALWRAADFPPAPELSEGKTIAGPRKRGSFVYLLGSMAPLAGSDGTRASKRVSAIHVMSHRGTSRDPIILSGREIWQVPSSASSLYKSAI